MSTKLFTKLESESVLITSLSRQAEYFRLAYANWKREKGFSAWPSPKIYSWTEWLKFTGEDLLWTGYSTAQGVRSLLTPLQEQVVWEQVIRSEKTTSLLHLPSTATIAKSAWQLIQAWRLPDPRAAKFPSDDVQAFTSWVEAYFKRCKASNWLDYARLPDTLKSAIKGGKLTLPENIILAGFVELTPQQLSVIKAIENQGTQVELYRHEEFDSKLNGYVYSSTNDEFNAIAQWCHDLLSQNPATSIGIVVPNLGQFKTDLEYALRKKLYPSSLLSKDQFTNTAYQFSGGDNLVDSEVASMAMNLLELIEGEFSLDHISKILRNPYCFGGRSELFERYKLDAWLRAQGILEFTLSSLLDILKKYELSRPETSKTTLFEVSLMTLKTSSGLAKNSHTPSIWAKHFLTYLEKFGWPSNEIGVKEQRQAQAMRICLTEFATLGFVQSEMNFKLALKSLKRIYQNKRLQGNQVFTPIQIMDFNEVYGLNFDFLWVAQMSDSELPESRKINPLIPFAWQKKRNISLSTPELCLLDAQKRLAHLKSAAPDTNFSFVAPEQNQQIQKSGLLDDVEFEKQVPAEYLALGESKSIWIDETHGALYENEKTVGTSLFKYQSECPFKAYAKVRLLSTRPEKNSYGLTALERGHLLHNSLEEIWKRIGDSDTLAIALENEHLEMQLWEIIDKVLSDFERKLNYSLSQRLKSIEQTRLVNLTLAWLRLERQRESFTVNNTEKKILVEINGLQVKGYVDRIDYVDNVGFVIIDYKSGSKSSNSWFGDRPDEPQMPIYALAEQNKVVALVYANLKPGDFSFNGVSKALNIFPGVKAYDDLSEHLRKGLSWAELMPYWREQLNAIAEDFKSGLAVPDPKHGLVTCNFCEMQTLCRIHANPDRASL